MNSVYIQVLPFILFALIWLVMIGGTIALYVLGALGAYTVAKHRGIQNAWLAWLPVGISYVYGALSDDVVSLRGIPKKYHSRVLLPALDGCAAGGIVLLFAVMVSVFYSVMPLSNAAASAAPFVQLPFMMLFALLINGTMIASRVFASIALYPVYREYCLPGTSLAFAVCGGIFGLHSIFLFAIRNKQPLAAAPRYYTGVPPQNL